MHSAPQPIETPLPPAVDCPIITQPRKSERLGMVLGVNLGGEEVALSVSRETRMPRASVVVTTAARSIIRISKAQEKVESIAVHGSFTDATLHPDFREITSNLRDLRNKWFPKAKLWLVSQDPVLDVAEVRRCLGIYDRVLIRWEWGTAKTFAALTGRKSAEFTPLADYIAGLDHLVLQARFYRGEIDNTTDAEVKAWVKKVGEFKPREVHILNPDSKPTNKKLKAAPKARVTEIAAELTEKTGIPATVYASEALWS